MRIDGSVFIIKTSTGFVNILLLESNLWFERVQSNISQNFTHFCS